MSSIQLSVVIASREPQKLSEFYAFATNGDLRQGITNDHYLIDHQNCLSIQIYRPSDTQAWPKGGRASALCFQRTPSAEPLSSINEWIGSLVLKGAEVVEKPKLQSFGAESWLIDPEGNYFLIYVPKDQ
ncbi:VOC family protein [Prochlorococcus sp. MIT 1307]|uniref:VOC family protein n=1 Tax=Prochlorococcus sp. MIT 1307 TaxID=3096219 RepID=UPI002A7491BF|nr:VOC family protein [Prochlorococcus sp. MIT 1307]